MTDMLYAWQVQEPDGRWSMIAAALPDSETLMPMVHRDLTIMERLTPLAEAHAHAMGQPLRLARFELAEILG